MQRVAPAGQKPDFWPVSKFNTGSLPLRGILPVTILSERGMIDPAVATPGTGGKLRMQLDVPRMIDSDLLLFKASPL